ncbi:hypothetical protein GCM10010230_11690 [Streptomyces narbonensis]|nr:hypothetical protein GCM10010230_11690 [Streptomyces narbonensis]
MGPGLPTTPSVRARPAAALSDRFVQARRTVTFLQLPGPAMPGGLPPEEANVSPDWHNAPVGDDT